MVKLVRVLHAGWLGPNYIKQIRDFIRPSPVLFLEESPGSNPTHVSRYLNNIRRYSYHGTPPLDREIDSLLRLNEDDQIEIPVLLFRFSQYIIVGGSKKEILSEYNLPLMEDESIEMKSIAEKLRKLEKPMDDAVIEGDKAEILRTHQDFLTNICQYTILRNKRINHNIEDDWAVILGANHEIYGHPLEEISICVPPAEYIRPKNTEFYLVHNLIRSCIDLRFAPADYHSKTYIIAEKVSQECIDNIWDLLAEPHNLQGKEAVNYQKRKVYQYCLDQGYINEQLFHPTTTTQKQFKQLFSRKMP